MICYKINLVFNKMEETFQSNTLDWSSLVIIIFLSLSFSSLSVIHNFVNFQPIFFKFSAYDKDNSAIMPIKF